MSSAESWLRERLPDAPAQLLETMLDALPSQASATPDALAAGAMALYARVAEGSGGRQDALPLLAADALLTHAFEAQAESDAGAIEELAKRWGVRGALGRVGR